MDSMLRSKILEMVKSRVGGALGCVETWHRALAVGLLIAGLAAGTGCGDACRDSFDCEEGTYCDPADKRCVSQCSTDEDCRNPPACADRPEECVALGNFCNPVGRCVL
jgi:hypothetical protein